MLTAKQHELLLFIHKRLGNNGVSPSFDEMKDAMGLHSKSGIHRLITGLEERGFIRRLAHRARALEVLRMPDSLSSEKTPAKKDVTPAPLPVAANDSSIIPLPLYGKIAAGTPIEALRDSGAVVDVPSALLGLGDHYALEVSGDSMVEAGILNGDTVIIKQCDSAENGSIVVALVNEADVTLKRLYRRGPLVDLEPANAAYKTQTYPSTHVKVQGKLVSLLRQYH